MNSNSNINPTNQNDIKIGEKPILSFEYLSENALPIPIEEQ